MPPPTTSVAPTARATPEGRRAKASERSLARALREEPGHGRGPHGLGLALQGQRLEGDEVDSVRDGERGHLADDDTAGSGDCLEPRRGVDDVAGDGAALGTRLPEKRLAAVDTHADSERAVVQSDRRTETLDRSDERQTGTDRPLGVVVARPRDAEDRHRGVADELLELAAMAPDRLAHGVEVRVLDERHVLCVEPLGKLREADEIGEQDGHDPPLDSTDLGHRPSPRRGRQPIDPPGTSVDSAR